MSKVHYKLTLLPMVMMIFSTVYGFANVPRAFLMMGYGAIFWYILAALAFFLPFAVMMAEFGYTYKAESGGIYSWAKESVGERFAFIIVFMWYTSFIIYLVTTSAVIWIPVAKVFEMLNINGNLDFVVDNLNNNSKLIGILAIMLVLGVASALAFGLKSVGRMARAGGFCVLLLNALLILGGFTVLILNKFHFAEPIEGVQSFIINTYKSNNILSLMGFAVFAIFAYGGLEVVSGLVDKVENPEKSFPKGLLLSAGIIAFGYSLMIFVTGMFTNWLGVMDQNDVNLGNVLYVVMAELGAQLGVSLGLGQDGALQMSRIIAGVTGASMVAAYTAAYFGCFYSPLKQIIEGTPTKLWPKFMLKRKNDMPVGGLLVQAAIVILIVGFNAFGGAGAKELMDRLVMMANVALTLPYVFIAIAYFAFRRNKKIEKPFLLIKNDSLAMAMAVVTMIFVGFANLFTVIEPLLSALKTGEKEAVSTAFEYMMLMASGPALFSLLGYVMYQVSLRKK